MRLLYFVTALSLISYAQENTSPVLMPLKEEIKQLQIQKSIEKQKVNQYDWVNDMTLNATQSKNQTHLKSEEYYLNLSQKIFDFGGITGQIQYSNDLFTQELLQIELNHQEDIYLVYENMIQLKLNDIDILQNNLNLQNSEIEVEIKKSQYQQGESDISELNNAIMTRNELEDSQMQLKLLQVNYENELKKLTSLGIEAITLPNIELISKESFVHNALENQVAHLESKISQTQYKIKKSSYLPSLTLNANYGYTNSTQNAFDEYYSYGASISMPLGFTANNDIQHSKLLYLQNKKEEELIKIQLEKTYETAFETIQQYQRRIELAQRDIALYNELIELNEEEFNAGFKALEEVTILKNSKQIRELDIQKHHLLIQKELYSLYFKVKR